MTENTQFTRDFILKDLTEGKEVEKLRERIILMRQRGEKMAVDKLGKEFISTSTVSIRRIHSHSFERAVLALVQVRRLIEEMSNESIAECIDAVKSISANDSSEEATPNAFSARNVAVNQKVRGRPICLNLRVLDTLLKEGAPIPKKGALLSDIAGGFKRVQANRNLVSFTWVDKETKADRTLAFPIDENVSPSGMYEDEFGELPDPKIIPENLDDEKVGVKPLNYAPYIGYGQSLGSHSRLFLNGPKSQLNNYVLLEMLSTIAADEKWEPWRTIPLVTAGMLIIGHYLGSGKLVKNDKADGKSLIMWIDKWLKGDKTQSPQWAKDMFAANNRSQNTYKDVKRGFVHVFGEQKIEIAETDYCKVQYTKVAVDKKDESMYEHNLALKANVVIDLDKIAQRQKMTPEEGKKQIETVIELDSRVPFIERDANVMLAENVNSLTFTRFNWLVVSAYPGYEHIHPKMSELVWKACKFVVIRGWEGVGKIKDQPRIVFKVLDAGMNHKRNGLIIKPESTPTSIVHQLIDLPGSRDVVRLAAMEAQVGAEGWDDLIAKVRKIESENILGDESFLLTEIIMDLFKRNDSFTFKNNRFEKLESTVLLANLYSWCLRATFTGYPSPPKAEAGIGTYATKTKIRVFEDAEPDCPELVDDVASSLSELTAKKPMPVQMLDIAKSTGSGNGTTIKTVFKGKGKITVKSQAGDSEGVIDFTKARFNVGKKSNLLPVVGGKLLNDVEFARSASSIFGPQNIGRRDDWAKDGIRLIYIISLSILIAQRGLTVAMKTFESKNKMYANANQAPIKTAQVYFMFESFAVITTDILSRYGKQHMFEEADYPKWDNHMKAVIHSLMILISKRLGPFSVKDASSPENELYDALLEYYDRFSKGKAIFTIGEGNSSVFPMEIDSTTSGEFYTTAINSFVNGRICYFMEGLFKAWDPRWTSWEDVRKVPGYEFLFRENVPLPGRFVNPMTKHDFNIGSNRVFGDDQINSGLVSFSAGMNDDDLYKSAVLRVQLRSWVIRGLGFGANLSDVSCGLYDGSFLNNELFMGLLTYRTRGIINSEKTGEKPSPDEMFRPLIYGRMVAGGNWRSFRVGLTISLLSASTNSAFGKVGNFDPGDLLVPKVDGSFVPILPFMFNPELYYGVRELVSEFEYELVTGPVYSSYDIGRTMNAPEKSSSTVSLAYHPLGDVPTRMAETEKAVLERERSLSANESVAPNRKSISDIVGKASYSKMVQTSYLEAYGNIARMNNDLKRAIKGSQIENAVVKKVKGFDIPLRRKIGRGTYVEVHKEVIGKWVTNGKGGVSYITTSGKPARVFKMVDPVISTGSDIFIALQMLWTVTLERANGVRSFDGNEKFSMAPTRPKAILRMIEDATKAAGIKTGFDKSIARDVLRELGYLDNEIEKVLNSLDVTEFSVDMEEVEHWKSAVAPELIMSTDRVSQTVINEQLKSDYDFQTIPEEVSLDVIQGQVKEVIASLTINDSVFQLTRIKELQEKQGIDIFLPKFLSENVVVVGRSWRVTVS